MVQLIALAIFGYTTQSAVKPTTGKELSVATKPLSLPSVLAKLKLSPVSVSEYESKGTKETARVFRYTFQHPATMVYREWKPALLAANWKDESKPSAAYWTLEIFHKKGPVVRQAILIHVGKISRREGESANTHVDWSARNWTWVSYNEMVPEDFSEKRKADRIEASKTRFIRK